VFKKPVVEAAGINIRVMVVKRVLRQGKRRLESHDGIDDFTVSFGHLGGVTLEVLGAEGCKDFMDGGHDRVPPLRD